MPLENDEDEARRNSFKIGWSIISCEIVLHSTIDIYYLRFKKSNLKAHKEWTIILQCKSIKAQNSFRLKDIFKEL